jgi:hypothetical protein
MGPILGVLVETLEAYFAAVKRSGDSSVDLQAYFQKLDMLARTLPPGTNPKLRHYLQQKSYRKAHEFLLGACPEPAERSDPEAGACGR